MEVHLVITWALRHLLPVFSPKAVMGLTVGLELQAWALYYFTGRTAMSLCQQTCQHLERMDPFMLALVTAPAPWVQLYHLLWSSEPWSLNVYVGQERTHPRIRPYRLYKEPGQVVGEEGRGGLAPKEWHVQATGVS